MNASSSMHKDILREEATQTEKLYSEEWARRSYRDFIPTGNDPSDKGYRWSKLVTKMDVRETLEQFSTDVPEIVMTGALLEEGVYENFERAYEEAKFITSKRTGREENNVKTDKSEPKIEVISSE